MSIFQQKINALIQTFQSGLIPEPDQQDLTQLLKNLPDNDRQAWQEIDNWLKVESRVKTLTAYEQKLTAILAAQETTELGPGRTEAKTTPNQLGESLKEQLKNAVQPISQPSQPSESEEE